MADGTLPEPTSRITNCDQIAPPFYSRLRDQKLWSAIRLSPEFLMQLGFEFAAFKKHVVRDDHI